MKPQKIMDLPLCEMSDLADHLSWAEMDDAIHWLQDAAGRAVWRAAYLEMRYGNGSTDQGHLAASKEANRQLTAVRKAMGFSYPQAGKVVI